jgi:predicted secreted Zn-dependent protease
MGIKIERVVYTTLLLFICAAAAAQPYKKLTSTDFRGKPQTGTNEIAFTHCSISYSYTAHKEGDYYRLDFNILLVMDHDRSWINRDMVNTSEKMTDILKHEQGHYNLAYMEQQELLRTVSHTVFRDNFRSVADGIFKRVNEKYQQLNLDYDDDTQNSTNLAQQRSWDLYFGRALGPILADKYVSSGDMLSKNR